MPFAPKLVHLLSGTALALPLVSLAGAGGGGAPRAAEETRVLLTGDVMLGRGVDQILPHSADPVLYEPYMRSARGYVKIAEEQSGPIPRDVAPGYVWGDLLAALETYEPHARVINLENAVTTADEPWPDKGIHYRMHPKNIRVLGAAGIDAAVLANNHVMDWGLAGLRETLATLHDAGIGVAGAGLDLPAAAEPVVLPVPGRRVLVFAMADTSSGVPRTWAATPHGPGVHLLADLSPETAREQARRIAARSRPGDLVVASIHWGGNWGYRVPREQERFARILVEEGGVDVVHGHSSHHPKGMELHHGRLILYGAGDLLNDYEGIGGHERFRPELTLAYLPQLDAAGQLVSLTLVPFRIQRFQLVRANEAEAKWLRERLSRSSEGLRFELTPERALVARPAADRAPSR
jgi:poly-gamma-glutamate synthesis protein (capsule biosynthesis protein)